MVTFYSHVSLDHDEFYRIATSYSFAHPTMKDKPKVGTPKIKIRIL